MRVITMQSPITCLCGSILKNKYVIKKHLTTKKHRRFEEGIPLPQPVKEDQAKYQRERYQKFSAEKRQAQRDKCKEYYLKNRDTIAKRHCKNAIKHRLEKKLKRAWTLRGLISPKLDDLKHRLEKKLKRAWFLRGYLTPLGQV